MKKILIRVLLALAALLILAWLFMPYYLRRALIYQQPGIDDYTIFENRKVNTAAAIPWAQSLEFNKLKQSDSSLNQFKKYSTVAYLLVRNDSLLHEEYWDGYSDSSLSNSFSVAKSIVSLLIGCLLDEGKISSLDQPVTDFLPEFRGAEFRKIRIRDVLTMSSGLDWDESYSSAFSITTKAYYGKDLSSLVTSLKPIEEPGKIFRYKSGDTQLLSMIIERVSGKHLADYASEKLWKPLGAEHASLWSLDQENGDEKAYCCFNSNARDFSRIGQLLLDSGQFAGKQIVSKEYIKQATSPASWLRNDKGKTCTWYGYQFWMLDYKGIKINYARGILGQYIFIIPAKNAVVVRLGKQRSATRTADIPDDVFVYLDAAFDLLR